jgi:hypothetical protein
MLILDLLFDWVGYRTARYLLPTITFRRAMADDVTSSRTGFNWFDVQREDNGVLLFSATMASWIGVLFWMLVFAGTLTLSR